jgi:hypothetical protein
MPGLQSGVLGIRGAEMKSDKVQFEATIKEKKEKIDLDECLTGRLVIEYTPSTELRKRLIDIFQPETTVMVTLEKHG